MSESKPYRLSWSSLSWWWSLSWWSLAIVVLALCGSDGAIAAAQDDASAQVLRSQRFVPDLAAIKGLGASSLPGRAAVASNVIHLDLFPDTKVDIEIERREQPGPDQTAIVGRVAGDPLSVAYIAIDGDALAADIILHDARYEVRLASDGSHVVRQVDPDAALDCATTFDAAAARPADVDGVSLQQPQRSLSAATDSAADSSMPAVVDLLVVYTPAAEAGAGGAAGMRSTIALAVTQTNDALQRSGVTHRFRLVHTARTQYVESGSLNTDLSRLIRQGDGEMEHVFALRDQVRADVVTLIVEASDHAGMAMTMYTFGQDTAATPLWNAVVRASISNSLRHELGHNAGLLHDRDNAGNGPAILPYAYGYRVDRKWATIMANSNCPTGPCPRIPYYSNPHVSYQGLPTGVADFADEARALNQTMPILANQRAACVTAVTPSPIVPASGGTTSITIAAAAGCTWNVDPVPAGSTWLTQTSPATGTGDGTVQYSAQPNPADALRAATIIISGSPVVVQQAGRPVTLAPPVPTPTPTPTPNPSPTPTPALTFRSYLAEAATGTFFSTRIALFNPGAGAAETVLRFLRDDGVVVTRALMLPGWGRTTILPESLGGLEAATFSTVIESSAPIIVDRTMTWDKTGRYGSHAETAVPSPSTTWYLAEGSTSGEFSLFYLLQNPNPTPVQARVRYLRPGGQPPIEQNRTLPPNSRTTIAVDDQGPELANTDLSAVITTDAPIIVERSMYMSRPGESSGKPFTAGHESAGVTAPATHWFLAEGATGPFFDLFILLANPDARDALVTIDYLLVDGRTFSKRYAVPANGRFTIAVDAEDIPGVPGKPLSNVAVSSDINSINGVPILVERTMWWPSPEMGPHFWTEAHNSPGARETGTSWALAEGEVGGSDGSETYILIANTSAENGDVRVRLYFEDGGSLERTYAVPARSRSTVSVSTDFPASAGRRFGAIVESLRSAGSSGAAAQIVVERAMYTSPGGQLWTAGTNALATRLQ